MRRDSNRRGVALVLVLVFSLAGQASAPAAQAVLPPGARPHGYSLTDMGRETAVFTLAFNDEILLPDTPFQVLYYDPSTLTFVGDDGGILGTASNSFTVPVGTSFFVPLWTQNDLPPVLGDFPTSPSDAESYFFDPDQVGGADFEVIVDGVSTPIGPAFLTGPVTVTFDGQDVQVITLGAFLHPLPPGTHTVVVRGGIFGDLVAETFGIDFVREDLTYTVEVVRP